MAVAGYTLVRSLSKQHGALRSQRASAHLFVSCLRVDAARELTTANEPTRSSTGDDREARVARHAVMTAPVWASLRPSSFRYAPISGNGT